MTQTDNQAVLNYDASKTSDYFAGARQDWIDRLPQTGGLSVLELGCGFGETGKYALSQGRCDTYYGIEIAPSAAETAKQNLTDVVVGDVETMELPFHLGQFDALLMSEVLEHLVDPWAVLRRLVPLVRPGGMIFASSPNVAHKDIIKELLNGTWELTNSGPKDRTHLRWFTPNSYRRLFEEQGVVVDQIGALNPNRSFKQRVLGVLTARKYDHLFAYQINMIGHVGDGDPNRS